jgi:uncharacterized protein
MYRRQPGTRVVRKIIGGVATGVAVGAGVVVPVEASGRSLMGNRYAHAASTENYGNVAPGSFGDNAGIDGQSSGLSGVSSWNDAGSSSDGGASGEWEDRTLELPTKKGPPK